MAIIKCKMCGGDMEISPDKTFGTCEYCGSTRTLPKIDDDQRAAMFNRGNHFRRAGEFDKALAVYERIVAEDDGDAEAHWCCALCRFGIEYVEDPTTYEYIPTCHRASFDSILQDVDYLAAIEHSDGITRRQYQKDAARIAEVQKGILATSRNEEPFDVFICYKETDAVTGERSRDSLDAQEVYYRLTEKGYRVFFARITLEDKAGAEYEPYIFAALNSAKVMIVLGSRPEHFSAVWVKNEWSRFLALMKKDRDRLLIPCYKNMDPYDLPEQLSVLQSYDMTKIGFIQDLIRGVEKVLRKDEPKAAMKEMVVVHSETDARTASAVKRGNMALEDGEVDKAKDFFDQALALDAENAEAYLGMALANAGRRTIRDYIDRASDKEPQQETLYIPVAEEHIRAKETEKAVPGYLEAKEIRLIYNYDRGYPSSVKGIRRVTEEQQRAFNSDRNLERAFRYASGESKAKLDAFRSDLADSLRARVAAAEQAEKEAEQEKRREYESFLQNTDAALEGKYADALERREKDYRRACEVFENAKTPEEFQAAADRFRALGEYKNSAEYAQRGILEKNRLIEEERKRKAAEDLAAKEAAERHARRKAEQERLAKEAAAKKRKRTLAIVIPALVVCIAFLYVLTSVIIPKKQYIEVVDTYINPIKAASVGDTIRIGHYEQDNNRSNGKEEIEWIVLTKDGNRALVISKYALDCQQFNSKESGSVSWKTSPLRSWLNTAFLQTAFTRKELALIPGVEYNANMDTTLCAARDSKGNDTVFLLSETEAREYCTNYLKCQATQYCQAQGASTVDGYCVWWLRSHPKSFSDRAARVTRDGYYAGYIDTIYYDGTAVRPALWIDLEA